MIEKSNLVPFRNRKQCNRKGISQKMKRKMRIKTIRLMRTVWLLLREGRQSICTLQRIGVTPPSLSTLQAKIRDRSSQTRLLYRSTSNSSSTRMRKIKSLVLISKMNSWNYNRGCSSTKPCQSNLKMLPHRTRKPSKGKLFLRMEVSLVSQVPSSNEMALSHLREESQCLVSTLHQTKI